jgi:hypothetical protein
MFLLGIILIALAFIFLDETAALYVTAAVVLLHFLNKYLNRRAEKKEKDRH